ncbi:putative reverse transcriptase domain-containing protein [Tanacetum coccineum]|uniref:Reverse transcriptase domain-containing protein n=1 Tax=Tanacetum coccineum TaxID=301880 RepID=A0ABQ5BCX3_9ASTR
MTWNWVRWCSLLKSGEEGLLSFMDEKELSTLTTRVSSKYLTMKDLICAHKAVVELLSDYKCEIEYSGQRRRLERHFEQRDDGEIYFFDRIWIPSVGGVRKLIMDEAHTSRYSVHPGADKILTSRPHFLPIRKTTRTEEISKIYTHEIVARHGVPVSIISDRDGRFTSHLWQAFQKALGTRLDMSSTYTLRTVGQSEKVPIDKALELRVQHQVSNRFEISLVGSEEDPVSPQERLQENLKLLVHPQVASSPTFLQPHL